MEGKNSQAVETNEKDYLEEINRLKENSVSKEDYQKILEENRKLIQTVARNEGRKEAEEQQQKTSKIDVQGLRKEIFQNGGTMTNLEYVSKVLELRKGVIQEGGTDPFLPQGTRISPTAEDIEKAENVAKCFEHCIEFAEGDSALFTNELNRLTKDTGPFIPNKN